MRLWLVVLLAVLGSASAQGQPSCNTNSDYKGIKEAETIGFLQHLKGAVELGGDTPCSASLVTFSERSASSRALVLSAGHCGARGKANVVVGTKPLAMPDRDEVFYRADVRRPLTLETGNSDEPRMCLEADQIVYGTMTGADILLLQVSETYEQIEKRTGVKPFLVSKDTSFVPETQLRLPSALWQAISGCQLDTTIEKLKEERWHWGPVMRMQIGGSCWIRHGASGAPAIRRDTGEVIGVLGTSGDASAAPCELNNPCELASDDSVKAVPKGQGYIHFVHAFYTCLDKDRNVDLEVPGCLLLKPKQ